MKLMNFRRFDEIYQSQGKVGLVSGGKTEAEVWSEFADDPTRLEEAATTIVALSNGGDEILSGADGVDEAQYDAAEGRLVTRTHVSRERSQVIVRKKKNQILKDKGRLACDACNFDFEKVYGERGKNFIECHHIKPVSELRPGQKTKLTDLALLCANCHRMIHSRRPWLTIDELKTQLIQSQ